MAHHVGQPDVHEHLNNKKLYSAWGRGVLNAFASAYKCKTCWNQNPKVVDEHNVN